MHRVVAFVGLLGGLAWIGLSFYPPECLPATDTSEVFCARLWTGPLAAMLTGTVVVGRRAYATAARAARAAAVLVALGYGSMTLGNFGEYWLAYQLHHQGPGLEGAIRGILWMSFLLGAVSTLVGSTILGLRLLRERTATVPALVLAAAIPIELVLASRGEAIAFIGIAVPALAIAAGHLANGRPPTRASAPSSAT